MRTRIFGWGFAASFIAILFAWSLHPVSVPAQTSAAPRPAAGVALRTEGLSRKEISARFRSLKDSDVVEIAGRRLTKAQLIKDTRTRERRILAKAKADSAPPPANLSELKTRFEADQKAALDASNAQARGEFAKLAQTGRKETDHATSPEQDALRREAIEMLHRAANASPAELEVIESRAQELLPKARQLKRAP